MAGTLKGRGALHTCPAAEGTKVALPAPRLLEPSSIPWTLPSPLFPSPQAELLICEVSETV